MAWAEVELGNLSEAIRWVDRAWTLTGDIEPHAYDLSVTPFIRRGKFLDPLRDDPRFDEILAYLESLEVQAPSEARAPG